MPARMTHLATVDLPFRYPAPFSSDAFLDPRIAPLTKGFSILERTGAEPALEASVLIVAESDSLTSGYPPAFLQNLFPHGSRGCGEQG